MDSAGCVVGDTEATGEVGGTGEIDVALVAWGARGGGGVTIPGGESKRRPPEMSMARGSSMKRSLPGAGREKGGVSSAGVKAR